MAVRYILPGFFVLFGALALLASLFNWDWFFTAQNTQFVVANVGRKQARLFYAVIGVLMIATGVFFFLSVRGIV